MPIIQAELNNLRVPQLRVLDCLSKSRGPLSRTKLADRCGAKTTQLVALAVGYDNADKRAKAESKQGAYPSLLTLGYVKRLVLDIDGIKESAYMLTPLGRKVMELLGELDLPPVKQGKSSRRELLGR